MQAATPAASPLVATPGAALAASLTPAQEHAAPPLPKASAAAVTPPPAADDNLPTAPTAEVPRQRRALSDEELLHGLAPLADVDEAAACKRRFEDLHARYTRLDGELGENTADFEELHRQLERSRGDVQKGLAERMRSMWEERRPSVHGKRNEYHRLHVELMRLRDAVNAFVRAQ